MKIKTAQTLVIFATLAVIFVNYLATQGLIGGITANYISDKYPTFASPAGYAFSIWGFIYLGLSVFSLFQAMPAQAEPVRCPGPAARQDLTST